LIIDNGGSAGSNSKRILLDSVATALGVAVGGFSEAKMFWAHRSGANPYLDYRTRKPVLSNSQYIYEPRAKDETGTLLKWKLLDSPLGMKIDSLTGYIQWSPSSQWIGHPPVRLQVTNGVTKSDTQSYAINRSPRFARSSFDTLLFQSGVFLTTVSAIDQDGDSIRYRLLEGGSSFQVDSITGVVSGYIPDTSAIARYILKIGASDGITVSSSEIRIEMRSRSGQVDTVRGILPTVLSKTSGTGIKWSADSIGIVRDTTPRSYAHVWIPNSNSTVSKIDVNTGRELSRIRTMPVDKPGDPSRTTVDLMGNLWIGNRQSGSLVKIGDLATGQCDDRNNDGIIQTSRDLNGDGIISDSEIMTFGQDECLLKEVVLIPGKEGVFVPGTYTGGYVNDYWSPGLRSVVVDRNNKVWIATFGTMMLYRLDGYSGAVEAGFSTNSVEHHGYTATIDRDGVMWSVDRPDRELVRFDITKPVPEMSLFRNIDGYGVAAGDSDAVYLSGGAANTITRFNRKTLTVDWVAPSPVSARGVGLVNDSTIWAVGSGSGTIWSFNLNGQFKDSLRIVRRTGNGEGSGPTGFSRDINGKAWVCDLGSDSVFRVNPASMTIEIRKSLPGTYGHYCVSDFAGLNTVKYQGRSSIFNVMVDSRRKGQRWQKAVWQSSEPAGTSILVQTQTSDDSVKWSSVQPVEQGGWIVSPPGRYIRGVIRLNGSVTATPVLRGISFLALTDVVTEPVFTSIPPSVAMAGKLFSYVPVVQSSQISALRYSLLSGPTGIVVDSLTGKVTWTPTDAQVGEQWLSLRVRGVEHIAGAQTWKVNVSVRNKAPVWQSVAPKVGRIGDVIDFQPLAIDPEGKAVSYLWVSKPSGSVVQADGHMTWTVGGTVGDSLFFGVRAKDGLDSASLAWWLKIQNVNRGPVITSKPVDTAKVGVHYGYSALATDSDGDTLTWRLLNGPIGASIDAKTGVVKWDTARASTSGVGFQIEASDKFGAVATQSWLVRTAVSASNLPPQILTNVSWVVRVGDSIVQSLVGVDPERGRVTFSKISGPAGLVLRSGSVVWTPAMTDTGLKPVTIRATDSVGAYTEVAGWVRVYLERTPPALSLKAVSTARVGESFKAYVEASGKNGVDSIGLWFGSQALTLVQGVATVTPTASGTFELLAKARDKYGFYSTARLPVEVAVQAVAIPPVNQPGSPTVGLTWTPLLPRLGDTVVFSVVASGPRAIAKRLLRLDGASLAVDASGKSKWVARAPGGCTLEAVAYDVDGASASSSRRLDIASQAGAGAVTAQIMSPRATDSADVAKLPEILGMQDVVASVGGSGLGQWALELSSDGKNWKSLKTGTGNVSNAVIGKIDATLLENGAYTIRLRAVSKDGSISTDTSTVLVRGERKVGIFTIGFTEMSIPMPGINLGVTRTYDSRRSSQKGDFGYGWSLDMNRVEVTSTRPEGTGWITSFGPAGLTRIIKTKTFPKVTIRIPGGRTQEFEAKASFDNPLEPFHGYMEYVALPGTYGKLEPADVSSSWIMMSGLLVANDQIGGEEGALRPYSPTLFYLTLIDGSQWLVDRNNGGIRQIVDANGNVVQPSAEGIMHSAGQGIQTHRDDQGRIDWIRDASLRQVGYNYDADGNLANVVDALGNVTSFKYDANHFLTDIYDARGVRALRTEYDSTGRMVRQINTNGDTVKYGHDLSGQKETVTDFAGTQTTFEYDERGNVTKKSIGSKVWSYVYDKLDRLLVTVHPDGSLVSSTWDAFGNELTSTNAMGKTVVRTYQGGTDKVTSEKDPLGRTTLYEYDSKGNLLRTKGPDGTATRRCGYSGGLLVSDTDALGKVTKFTYDAYANPLTRTDALGRVTRYVYDSKGNLLQETDLNGRVTKYEYDANGNRLASIDPSGVRVSTEYSSFGKPRVATDKLGRKTMNVYDAFGQQTGTTYADGSKSSRGYDDNGNVSTTTDVAGRLTTMSYDTENRLTSTTFADGTKVKSEYDAMGRRTASIDARGNRTTYEYDKLGRDTLVRDALGNVTKSRYDAAGRKIEVVNALGQSTKTRYDLYDRVVAVVYPDGTKDSTEYDLAGRKTATIDAEGRRTEFTYDAVGQLLSVKDANKQTTSYTYDAVGNRVSQTDAKSRTTQFRYDLLGRLTTKVYPDAAKDSTEYDIAGRVSKHIAPNGEATTYEYDLRDREVKRTYLTSGHTVATTWNVDGSRSTVLDARGLTQYGYDARGRLANQTNPDCVVLRWTYDSAGRMSSRITPWGAVRYHYTALGQMDSAVDTRAGAVAQTYDALGRLKTVSRPNGVTTSFTYTKRGLQDTIWHKKSATELARFTYSFDKSGLRTGSNDKFGTSTAATGWNHDSLLRLTKETISGVAKSWGYDSVSNRTTQISGATTESSVFDSRDRLRSVGTTTYAWDASGRLTSRTISGVGTTRYGWHDDDRLRRIDLASGGALEYTYDAQGLMASRIDASGTERYTWDGTLPYGQMVASTNASGTLKAREVWGTDHLAEVRNDTVLWLLTDGLGHVRAVADSVGKIIGRQDFDAWGNRRVDSGRTVRFGYRGEWSDAATGLVYLRARWMDPQTGRFVSEDPYEGKINQASSLHRFLYAYQSPVNFVDPNGRFGLGEMMASMAINDILLSMDVVFGTARVVLSGVVAKWWIHPATVALEMSYELPADNEFFYLSIEKWREVISNGYKAISLADKAIGYAELAVGALKAYKGVYIKSYSDASGANSFVGYVDKVQKETSAQVLKLVNAAVKMTNIILQIAQNKSPAAPASDPIPWVFPSNPITPKTLID
jgi:RHS repeat-associated protein